MKTVFDKFWFAKHQKPLLWLANSWFGKYIFRFKKMGHYLNNKIVKITPNSVAELISIQGDKVELKEHFFSRNEYARKLYFYLYPLWFAMHIWDWFVADHFQLAPKLSFGFDTLTAYPVAGANSPVDGRVLTTPNATWATVHDATDGSSASATEASGKIVAEKNGAANYYIYRGFLLYDTSSIDDAATISAAVMSLCATGSSKDDSDSSTVDIVASTPASDADIVTGDFDQVGTTVFGTMTIANYVQTNGSYNDFTLNASGISAISKTGISKFGVRIGRDTTNTAPTSWNGIYFYFADNTTNKPTLVVTYSVASAATGNMFMVF